MLANKKYEVFIDVDGEDIRGYQRTPVVIEANGKRLFFTSIGEAMKALGLNQKQVFKNNLIDEAIDSAAESNRIRRDEARKEQDHCIREYVAEKQL
jgi:hypothetical protein